MANLNSEDPWTVCVGIFALIAMVLLSRAPNLRGGQQIASLRGRGVPGYAFEGNNDADGEWKDFGDALALPCGDLRIPPNIDPEGQYNVPLGLADQHLAIPAPVRNIDAENETLNADLNNVLLLGQVVGLPQQIERDEANRPQALSSVAGIGVAPPSLVEEEVAGGPQRLPGLPAPPQTPVPEVVAVDGPAFVITAVGALEPGIVVADGLAAADARPHCTIAPDALVAALDGLMRAIDANHAVGQPNRIGDEAEAQVEEDVPTEAFPPCMLELVSNVARLPQFATASMTLPAGDLESNLEERMPVDQLEAGDSSTILQAEVNAQDDVENSETVEEPHAKGMQ